jgi:hypothetical protein
VIVLADKDVHGSWIEFRVPDRAEVIQNDSLNVHGAASIER